MKLRHSPSSSKLFETCPRRYWHERIARDVERDPPGEAQLLGTMVHEAIERRMKDGEELPPDVSAKLPKLKSDLDKIQTRSGFWHCEYRLALDQNMRPCAYEDGWIRGVADMICGKDDKTLVIDYKTGKYRPHFYQLEFYSLAWMLSNDTCQQVTARFEWLKSGRRDERVYTRRDIPSLALGVLRPVLAAERETGWHPRPSGLCRNYCPVPSSMCPHSGREG